MKANNIYIQSIPELKITECKIIKKVNDHFTAEVNGYLLVKSDAEIDGYLQMERIDVIIIGDDHETHSIFKGFIIKMCISPNDKLYEISILAESYTRLLDIESRTRVFQDENWTYKGIAKYILDCNDNAVSIYNRSTDVKTDGLLVQYKETDWEFLKRIASKLNTVLVTDCKVEKASFYFGLPQRTHMNDFSYFSIKKNFIVINKRKILEFVLTSRDVLNLLDKITMEGMELYVYTVNIQLIKGEIVSKYVIRQLKDFYSEKYSNTDLTGITMAGRVTNVKGTQVQVDIDRDSVKDNHRRWFDFATVYSSHEGTGWYCMPENEDKIGLYFPNDNETSAYVVSMVHSEETDDLRTNPDEKFIRTIHRKEIRLTPKEIVLTNHKGMEVTLDDDNGIMIKSNKDIVLKSSDSINLESGDRIEIEAQAGICLRQNRNVLLVKDGILEQASNIEHR